MHSANEARLKRSENWIIKGIIFVSKWKCITMRIVTKHSRICIRSMFSRFFKKEDLILEFRSFIVRQRGCDRLTPCAHMRLSTSARHGRVSASRPCTRAVSREGGWEQGGEGSIGNVGWLTAFPSFRNLCPGSSVTSPRMMKPGTLTSRPKTRMRMVAPTRM